MQPPGLVNPGGAILADERCGSADFRGTMPQNRPESLENQA
jgi:hypothetical protein